MQQQEAEPQEVAVDADEPPSMYCAICCSTVAALDATVVLPCTHGFCRGCIDELFVLHHTVANDYASQCPMCRAPLFGSADESFGQAMDLLEGGNYDAAVELFGAARDAAMPFATGPAGQKRLAAASQYNIGRAHQRAGRYEAAALAYRAAFELSAGTDAMAVSNEGSMMFELGRQAAAVACWLSAVALDPMDMVAHHNLGYIYIERGDLAAAQLKVDLLMEHEPLSARSHNLQGVIFQRQGQTELARAAYTRALELNP